MTKVKLSHEGFEEALANATEADAPSVWHQDLLEHDANQRHLARIGAAVLERVDADTGFNWYGCPACGATAHHYDDCPLTRYLEATDGG